MKNFPLKLVAVCVTSLVLAAQADEFPEVRNTQAAGEHPPSPKEMLDLFELPPGFKVTLFAGEPDVQQPIAFDFDDHGRIWVAENYTYSARGKVDQVMRDRVIILHDKDGDGQHDERKVFWDKGKMLTGLTWGYGGLWILNDGNLSFIPDKDGDDVPDSEPVPMLNGWTKNAGHNVVNGLLWGPDGWLYGRHGITDTSYPGTIDTPKEERKPLNCGIWRFHPVKHKFEIVCHGTTNPWGLDYNEVGDMFMSNNVIGHLWHVIPGAHYQRMFGQDFNPHCYELMGPISDHFHWDESGKWSESRDGKADDLGGGHSHCGLMLYYGQNFPKEYWGKAFMCNTHGRCVNVDRIERKGSSYVAKHEPNFLKVNTPWFRGVQLAYGPAGCVYLSDWSDNGECHDHDGVHRTSGRIYRISYGEVRKEKVVGLSKLESFAVGDWTWGHESEWHQRREFRGLAEQGQACSREIVEDSKSMLRMDRAKSLGQLVEPDGFDARALSLVHIANALSPRLATSILLSRKPKVRAMAVRVVTQSDELTDSLREVLIGLAKLEKSPEVLLEFAIALQHLSFKDENSIGREIAKEMLFDNPATADMSDDPVLRSMIWFGVEPHWRLFDSLWEVQDKRLLGLCTRRLAAAWPLTAERILSRLRYHIAPFEFTSDEEALDFVERTKVELRAIIEGLKGLDVPPLSVTNQTKLHSIAQDFREFAVPEVKTLFNHLQVTLDGSNGIQHLLELVRDRNEDGEARSRAIETLARVKNELTIPIVLSLLNDRAVYVDICKALAAFDEDPRIPKELLKRWNNLRHGAQEAAADTLCSRKSYAVEFTKAIADGRVHSNVLTAAQVRQLNAFND